MAEVRFTELSGAHELNLPTMFWACGLLLVGIWLFNNVLQWLRWQYLDGIQVVGPAQLRMILDRTVPWKSILTDSYQKYSKNGKAFRTLGFTVIPPRTFSEYRRAPSKTLDSTVMIDHFLNFQLWLGKDHLDVVNFIKANLIKNLPNMIRPIREELKHMFDTQWSIKNPRNSTWSGLDGTKYARVQVYPAMLQGIGRVSARILAGRDYAENPEYIARVTAYASGVTKAALFFRHCPEILKPLLASYVPTATHIQKLKDILREDVTTWIKLEAKGDEGAEDPNVELVLLRLLVKYVQALPDYKDASPERVLQGTLGRLISAMFATVDTTTATSTHVIYDLTSQPYEMYAGPIKREIDQVFAENGGEWTQRAINSLPHLDSFIKESQRLHAISLVLATRYVSTPGGYTLKASEGSAEALHCPQGDFLCMPVWPLHTDPDHYDNPFVFNGFRFAKDSAPSSQPSDKFLAFGHGKHSCPGRLLALSVVKLMVIEFLSRYDDFKVIDERPKDTIFGPGVFPNHTAYVDLCI